MPTEYTSLPSRDGTRYLTDDGERCIKCGALWPRGRKHVCTAEQPRSQEAALTFRGCPPGECSHCDRDREFTEQPRSQEALSCRVMGASPHDRDQGALCVTHNRRLRECEQPRSQEAAHMHSRFDHDGTWRHHHHDLTGDPVWWTSVDQFGGEKREHRHPEQPRSQEGAHWPTLVFEDGDGDLCRCDCGEQGFDFQQGREWFAKHIAALAATPPEPEVPDGTREFVAFAVEYLRLHMGDHPTVRAGDRILETLP